MSAEPAALRRLAPWIAFAAALALYHSTLAPGLLWSDSAKLLIQVADKDVFGFGHGRHPLHTALGMVFARLGLEPAYSQNLLSAVAGAAAVGFLTAAALTLASPGAALLAGLALAMAHTVWLYAVINESYSLLWALLALGLWQALARRAGGSDGHLVGLALAAGLAISAHSTAVLVLPGLMLIACSGRDRLPGWRALLAAAAALAGGSLLVWWPGPAAGPPRESLGLWSSTVAHVELYLEPGRIARELPRYPAYLLFQLPGLAFIALLVGLAALWRRSPRLLAGLAIASAPLILFASGYMAQRQFAMLGATYLLLAPAVAVGFDALAARVPGRRLHLAGVALVLLAPPVAYLAAWRLAEARGLPLAIRTLPHRDEARFFLWPPKNGCTGARRYVEEARRLLPPGAILVGDFNATEPLRYVIRAEGSPAVDLRPVVDDFVLAGGDPGPRLAAYLDRTLAWSTAAVYLADVYEPYYRVSYLAERFDLTPAGPFLRVRPHGGPAAAPAP